VDRRDAQIFLNNLVVFIRSIRQGRMGQSGLFHQGGRKKKEGELAAVKGLGALLRVKAMINRKRVRGDRGEGVPNSKRGEGLGIQ